MTDNPYRDIPSVDVVARSLGIAPRLAAHAARQAIEEARQTIDAGGRIDVETIVARARRISREGGGVTVINATGVLLHTNLGRASWSEEALRRATAAAQSTANLEMDLSSGERSRRGRHVESLLTELTGAEAAMVVNNNAAAVLLVLAATANGRAVPVSRGELIEIGGAYRLPSVMEASGCRLIEVGTTNRTRLGDYVTAIQTHRCGAILKVHPSNYAISGFTAEAGVAELAALAGDSGIPLIHDVGSGLIDSNAAWLPSWLEGEPGVRQSVGSGADLVTFSGDKLLGGPQAGVIVGTGASVALLHEHPLARALRVDAVTYAALAATLEAHLDPPPLSIPFWRSALAETDLLMQRARDLADRIGGEPESSEARVGAGSVPVGVIPSAAVRLTGRQSLYLPLLDSETPVLARRDGGDLLIDMRAVDPGDDETIATVVLACR